MIRPSKKAMAKIQAEIKALTCRRTLALPKGVIIQKLNEAVRGWVGYFYYGNCSRNLATTKRFLEERARIYLRRNRRRKTEAIASIQINTFTQIYIFTRFRPPLHGPRLRMPLEEDDRKAVFGKTECTV